MGCSKNAAETESVNSGVHNITSSEAIGSVPESSEPNDASSEIPEDEFDENGNLIVKIPENVQNGDILNDGSVYFEDVVVNGIDDIVAMVNQYNPKGKAAFFTTPNYTGFVEKADDGARILKRCASFSEHTYYHENGIINTDRENYEDGILVSEFLWSTEADYHQENYYDGNIKTTKMIENESNKLLETSIYETVENQNGSYRVLLSCEKRGYKQEFTYADVANKILATMTVTESDGTTYTYTMDGKGNEPDHIVTMKLTKNGRTTTHSKGNFPFAQGYVTPPGFLQ